MSILCPPRSSHARCGLLVSPHTRLQFQRNAVGFRSATRKLQITTKLHVASQTSTEITIASLKEQLKALSGTKNGTDRDEQQRKAIAEIIQQLNEANPTQRPATAALEGTEWVILYTDSSGNSSGKLGPFVGVTGQRFPADTPGRYVNYASFFGGALAVELQGEYEVRNDTRINLLFKSTSFSFLNGLIKTTPKEFLNGGVKAHWVMRYVDKDLRILETNKGSVFVLTNVTQG